MFHKRQNGLVSLEPLLGRYSPVKPAHADSQHASNVGELQDLRNRLGLLLPPCLRFVTMEICLQPPLDPKHQKQLMDFLDKEYTNATLKSKPYYVDPYGRDIIGSTVQEALRLVEGPKPKRPCIGRPCDQKTWAQRPMQEAMEEARQRREEQRQRDGQRWGKGADKEFFSSVQNKPASGVPKVSSHLYKPRSPHTKSEWTKNTELALAKYRKKDILDVSVNRLKKQKEHGDHIRLARGQKDMEDAERLVNKLQGKDERFEKFKKSKMKY